MNPTYNSYSPSPTLSPAEIERIARRRAGAKLGWFIHATVFIAVNTLLLTISLASSKPWAMFPLAGWGLGLAIHGAAVWLRSPGSAFHEKLLRQERARLQSPRDPWYSLARIFHHDSARRAQSRDGWLRDATTRGRVPSGRSSVQSDARLWDATGTEPFCRVQIGFEQK
jgi:hypothetical protein